MAAQTKRASLSPGTPRKRRGALRVLAKALEGSVSPAVITDPAGYIEFANPAFAGLTGYRLDELVGAHVALLESDRYDHVWQSLAMCKAWSGDLVQTHKDGSRYCVSAFIFPIRGPDGYVSQFVVMNERIDDPGRREQDGAKRVADITMVASLEGTILYLNRTVPGVEPDAAIGSSIYDYIPCEEQEWLRSYVDQVITTAGAVHYTIEGLGPFGTRATYTTHLGPITVAGQVVALSIATEEVARAGGVGRSPEQGAAERFDSLPRETGEAMAIHDRGIILDANHGFAELFGYQLDDVIGRHVGDFVAPEHRGLVMGQILNGFEGPYQALAARRNGATFPVEVWGRNILYQGRPARVASIRTETTRKPYADSSGRSQRAAYGDQLSERELEVLTLLAQGLTDRQLGDCLGVTRRTTSHHVGAILRKLGVPNRTAAALAARRAGLVPADPRLR